MAWGRYNQHWLWRAARSPLMPWSAANALFKTRDRFGVHNRLLDQIGVARTVAGFVTAFVIWTGFGGKTVSKVVDDTFEKAAITLLVAVPGMVLCMAVLVVATRREVRARAATQMVWPLVTVGIGLIVVPAIEYARAAFLIVFRPLEEATPYEIRFLVEVLASTLQTWTVTFLAFSLYLVARHLFRAADGHPLLAPAFAVLLGWTVAVVEYVKADQGTLSTAMWIVLLVTGPATITALASWEWRVLRRVHGITLRSGPWPRTQR